MLKIPESMYGKGPKNNPSPGKDYRTSGSHAYGDAELRMLNKPQNEIVEQTMITVKTVKPRGLK